jgi:antitoxin component of RelBE/YafQ-DinJ toxin-antitoxin module
MPSTRDQINVRASDEAVSILYALQDRWGISQAAIIEMLLRKAARDEGLEVNELVHMRANAPDVDSRKGIQPRAAASRKR